MMGAGFLMLFWAFFISQLGAMGIALTVLAGKLFALDEYASAVTAGLLAAGFGVICLYAFDTLRRVFARP